LLAKHNDNILKAFDHDSYGKHVEKSKDQFGFGRFISLIKTNSVDVSNMKKVV